jgi:hypothetical protein
MNKDALAAVEENPELTPEFILMNEDDLKPKQARNIWNVTISS